MKGGTEHLVRSKVLPSRYQVCINKAHTLQRQVGIFGINVIVVIGNYSCHYSSLSLAPHSTPYPLYLTWVCSYDLPGGYTLPSCSYSVIHR